MLGCQFLFVQTIFISTQQCTHEVFFLCSDIYVVVHIIVCGLGVICLFPFFQLLPYDNVVLKQYFVAQQPESSVTFLGLSSRFSCCLKMKSVENILGYIREQVYRFLRGYKPRDNLSNYSLFRLLYSSTSTVQRLEISRVQNLEISRLCTLEISRRCTIEVDE